MSSFFNLFRGSSSKSSSRQNPALQSKPLHFEVLEQREMLAITSIIPEVYEDTVSKADTPCEFYLELTSDSTSKWVTVGLIVEPADGSALDPSQIVIKYYNEDTEEYDKEIPSSTLFYRTDDENKSMIIVNLPGDTYLVQVSGDEGTVGDFIVDVYVPGGTEENPTSVEQYTPLLVQAGMHQISNRWNPAMELIYKNMLGNVYEKNIGAAYPELNVTETGQLNQTDASILGSVAASGKVTAELTKTEPDDDDDLTFSSATVTVQEKDTELDKATDAITVTGGSSTSLADYTVVLSSTYTISGGSGADLSGVTLPTLTSGTDYKFDGGKFYFNPNEKFDFIPKGTTATLTLSYTATDKTTTSLTGTGTITVQIVGANDTPELDKDEVDLTSAEIWSQPWSETVDGVNKTHEDTIVLTIDGDEIKHGSTVIATIEDVDVSDTFTFASIDFPAGSAELEDGVWTLWTSDSDKKAVGEISLSEDGKTLTYKAAGDREDSVFKDLENDEDSDPFKFTFTVKDNRGVTANVTGGDKVSESGTCSIELIVKGMQDPKKGLNITSTGTTEVSLQALEYDAIDPPSVPLTAFFTVENVDDKILAYSFSDMKVSDDGLVSQEITDEIASSIMAAFELSGSEADDGILSFNRSAISVDANAFLNAIATGEHLDITFKIKVKNADSDTEYMLSETLTVRFVKSVPLTIEESVLSVSQHDDEWISATAASKISGGVGQKSPDFYDLAFLGDYTVTYTSEEGMVHEKPDLVEGEDYKYEIVTINKNTGEIGVNFYFNPNGKFSFLVDGQDAVVTFSFSLDDAINPMITCNSTWVITVRGEAESPIPDFKEDLELSTDENKALTINATDLINNENSETSKWVVEQIYVKAEEVELINGSAPDPSKQTDGYYAVNRYGSTEETITLKSGTVLKLVTEGILTFDPTGRTDDLDPYNENDPDTYADETFRVFVKDSMSSIPATSQWIHEFTVRVKGIAESSVPEFKDVDLSTFQNSKYTITGNDVATSTNSGAKLVIDQITLKFDEVETVNGEEPDEDDNDDGDYTINRPTSGSITIVLTNGTTFSLDKDGEITYDPTTREDTLEPYNSGNVNTFSDTELTFLVKDISEDPAVATASTKKFVVRTKGVHYPEFLTDVDLSTWDSQELTIKATDLAKSTKTDAELVVEEIFIDADKVALINGLEPEDEDLCALKRSETADQTIVLKSGTVYTLTKEGELKIDPKDREPLEQYNPNDENTYEDEDFLVTVADISISTPASTKDVETFTVRIKGGVESEDTVPTFKSSVDLNTPDRTALTIEATDLAESNKSDAELVIEKLTIDTENIELINGESLSEEEAAKETNSVQRSETDQTIALKSGTVLTLTPEGELKFDPMGREQLPLYDADDPTTYDNEEFAVLVADISGSSLITTAAEKTFSVLVKGTAESGTVPTFKDSVNLNVTEGGDIEFDADEIAESENEDAVLQIYQVAVAVENVKSASGTPVDGYYVLTLGEPTTTQSIILNSGAEIKLFTTGRIMFDASELDITLSPYDEDDGDSYIDEKVSFAVRDTSETPNPATALQEFNIRIKGPEAAASGDDAETLMQTFSVLSEPATLSGSDDTGTQMTSQWDIDDTMASTQFAISDAKTFSVTNTIADVVFLDWVYGNAIQYTNPVQTLETDDPELHALYDHISNVVASKSDDFTFDLDEWEI